MNHELARKNEAKRTPRLKNNRYRVITRDGNEEVYADTREEAAHMAARAGHVVRYVIKVETIHSMPPKRVASFAPLLMGRLCGLALLLAPAFAQAECVENALNRPGRNGQPPTGCFVKPTPAKPLIEGCIAYENTSPDPKRNKCIKWKEGYGPDEDAEGIVPGEALDPETEEEEPVAWWRFFEIFRRWWIR